MSEDEFVRLIMRIIIPKEETKKTEKRRFINKEE